MKKPECMQYICEKIILVTKFEKNLVYFKTKVVVEFFGDFFNDIRY
jgi:hypothetical protein